MKDTVGINMDEAVTNYINSHSQHQETVHVDASGLGLNIHTDPEGRLVTVMHPSPLPQLSRQISVSEQAGDGPWSEELDGKLAALVAQLAQHSRISNHQNTHGHNKVSSVRDVESTVILDTPLRHYSSQPLDQPDTRSVVEILPPLPSLQGMKRCPSDWFHSKTKGTLKETQLLDDEGVLDLNPGSSPAQHKQNKKSLPHKKRISRKLKRNTVVNSSQEDNIVEITCTDDVQHEEILPDNFVSSVHPVHHITQVVRPVLICQICGDFYGEEQLKFYQHLKQHYEPHATIIIENPVSDQMTNSCIVDNVAPIPDSIVELTLENSLPKTTMYQPVDKNYSLYTTTSDKIPYNKVQYTMASDKDVGVDDEKDMYETLEKIELYSCTRCNKSFRRQKNCEQHIKEVHCKQQIEEISEFSEPEDLMAGIHVSVEEHEHEHEHYEPALLPHLTVDSGHVHQEHHHKHWYSRSHSNSSSNGGGCTGDGYCPLCVPRADSAHHNLKEEIIQRIFDAEVSRCDSGELLSEELPEMGPLPEVLSPHPSHRSHPSHPSHPPPPPQPPHPAGDAAPRQGDQPLEQVTEGEGKQENKPSADKHYDVIEINDGKKKSKIYSCNQCPRHFNHRNSVLYHKLSHSEEKPFSCKVCHKGFCTSSALKIHMRVHNDVRPYKCDECGREFRQWGDLKYHVASLHTDRKDFKCDFCGKEFARKYSLNLHRRIHTGEKNYKCELCNKSFRASSYRLSHMRTHTGYKPHNCPICNKAFRVSADVRRHLQTHERARLRQEAQVKITLTQPQTLKIKQELTDQPTVIDTEKIKAVKKIATASTTRPPLILKAANPKKPKADKAKRAPIKRGAPNVVITNNKEDVLPKNLQDNQIINLNQHTDYDHNKKSKLNSVETIQKHINSSLLNEQPGDGRQFAVLKPIPKTERIEVEKVFISPPNTDGKMAVFTHIEKNREANGQLGTQIDINDLRQNIEIRENRGEIAGEGNESGFIERLTALYNISAV